MVSIATISRNVLENKEKNAVNAFLPRSYILNTLVANRNICDPCDIKYNGGNYDVG